MTRPDPVVKIAVPVTGGVAARLIGMWPPGCGEDGCVSHLAAFDPSCTCPQWYDAGGTHLANLSRFCTAHPARLS